MLVDSDSCSDYDSLFDGELDAASLSAATSRVDQPSAAAQRSCSDVPGLFFSPSVEIPSKLAEELWSKCMQMFFRDPDVNQVMLFERARSSTRQDLLTTVDDGDKDGSEDSQCLTAISAQESGSGGLPSFLTDLLHVLDGLLRDHLPSEKHALLFPRPGEQTQARQVILNHYRPGEGITPHVDLLGRYGDGIIGVSLNSGCVMRFARVTPVADAQSAPENPVFVNSTAEHAYSNCDQSSGSDMLAGSGSTKAGRNLETLGAFNADCPQNMAANEDVRRLYLPARSVLVLCDDARYGWTHGIERLTEDLIESVDGAPPECVPRGERLSITFRWLLPGADVVGGVME